MALLFRALLILTLIAASALLAPMRGQMAGASQIEICSDAGTEILTLDARGLPANPHQPCPDCALCLAAAPLPDSCRARPASGVAEMAYPLAGDAVAAGRLSIHPTARGPPPSV